MKRTIKRAICIGMLMVLAAAPVMAQANTLAVSGNKTVVDGVITNGEYSFQQDFGQMKIYLNLTADTLWIGAVGSTKGWVAIGLGSTKMDGSTIFMGFLTDGKVQFKPQAGIGHRHQDITDKQIADSIISSAMKQDGDKTTLEVALKASTYIKKDQGSLDMIFAIGPIPSFTVIHTYHGSLSVKLAS